MLSLMAEGCSNQGIGQALYLSEGTIEKHVHHILDKLDLGTAGVASHRRILAVIKFLDTV
ncbi:response regulator transcription factor [Arthrobacter sp. TMN-37]